MSKHPAKTIYSAFEMVFVSAASSRHGSPCQRLKGVHLRDMISLEMIDASWLKKFPAELAARLKELFDDPDC